MAAAWSRARSAGLERWQGPSRRDRPSARGFARACASGLRRGSWRSGPGSHAGLWHRGRRRWRRCGEGAALQYQYRWTLRRSLRRAGPRAANGDVEDNEEGVIENPGAAGGPLRRVECGAESGVDVKADSARYPFGRVEVKVIGKFLAGGQAEGRGGVARLADGARAMQRSVDGARLLADVFHDVDFAALRPADGADVIAKHPESGPHSLPRRSLDAGFEAAIGLAEKALSFEAS